MPPLSERMTARLGPLPVWAWGVIVGGLVVAYLYFARWREGASTAPTETAGTASSLDKWAAGYLGQGGGVVPVPEADSEDAPATGSGATNWAWLAQGVRIGQTLGFTPTEIQGALQAYLDGGTTNERGKTIVDAIVSQLGVPPDGTYGTLTVTPDAPASEVGDLATYRNGVRDLYMSILKRPVSDADLDMWVSRQVPLAELESHLRAQVAARGVGNV